ncbi:MAG: hypothetical protein CL609_04210 [Anaerolineaceae bacterium]|nr:hypothetical protein [Anaerolineaceae bacterium]
MTTDAISSYNLDSSYVSMIREIMSMERQPLNRLEEKRDSVTVQKAIYTDLNGMLTSFQSSVKGLLSSDASYSFKPGNTAALSGLADGVSFGSVSAGSSAIPGSYEIQVTNLAQAHRVRSKQLQYSNQQLGYTGSFVVGGAESSNVNFTASGSVTTSTTTDIESGKTGLGSGSYFVETRNDPEDGWQFRLVNNDGQAVSIKNGTTSDYTTGWQSIPTGGGSYDTGRGFSMEFADPSGYTEANAGTRGYGAAEIDFTAKGTTIEIETSNSLVDIASKINAAKYTEGNEVIATIVDNQLILSGKYSGDNRNIQVSDVTGSILADLEIYNGSAYVHQMQAALSANFKVNGLDVKRSQNSGLTDVIHGVTLNFVKDAEGKTATLNVTASTDSNKKQITGFIGEFNKLTKYLTDKIATTKKADDTYTRGALAGDMVFSSLRYDLLRLPSSSFSTSGSLSRLRDIGITMDKDLKLEISDSSKLETALLNNREDVVSLLDAAMNQMNTKVSRFLGTSGYLTTKSNAADRELENTKDRITTLEGRLTKREAFLYQQYAEMQAQIMTMTYQSQQFGAMYGSSYYG